MNDLLGSIEGKRRSDDQGDIEMGDASSVPMDKDTQQFQARVKSVKQQLAQITQIYKHLEDKNESSKTITKSDQMKVLRQEMQDDINKANTIATKVKTALTQMEKENKSGKFPEGSVEERTRINLTSALMRQFKKNMDDFYQLRERIRSEYREVVERRYFTIYNKKPPEEKIDHMIETGESESLFQQAILEQGRGRVLDTLAEINERHEAVKELERSMLEMHQMFLDMAVLVEEQGAQLDNIETQVKRAKAHVEKGTAQLEKARRSQKSSRCWMCVALIILLIVIIVIVGAVRPWRYFK